MIVVATTADQLDELRHEVVELGGSIGPATSCGVGRLVVHADGADERDAERIAAALRAAGFAAVTRPSGARLTAWLADAEPVRFGERLTVCAAWSTHDRDTLPGLVEIGPGGFGNGHHPTTRLLIEQLLGRLAGGERLLDVGCGSGVLGLSALRLGAARVVAVDVKGEAVDATRRNARLNGMSSQLTATTEPLDAIDEPFDVVLANIARDGLVELAPSLVRLVAPGGWLAASGISPAQCPLVAGYLRPLTELERTGDGEWAALVLGHPA